MNSWHLRWLVGAVLFIPAVAALSWRIWIRVGPRVGPNRAMRTVYANAPRAKVPFLLGIAGFYYAAYAITSALSPSWINATEASVHLVIWTLLPPLWFFFEWFVFFDNHGQRRAVEALKTAQDLAGKFWGAVLTLLGLLKLADIVRPGCS